MTTHGLVLERAADLGTFRNLKAAGKVTPFAPLVLAHVYIKLDFKAQFENARTAEDAKGFLRSVARAGIVVQRIAERWDGVLMELQGSMLHAAIPVKQGTTRESISSEVKFYCADVHQALSAIFNDPRSRVEGWRMAADLGKTLVVAGRGVHGDNSWVSLGKAANRPAKHIYAQLELPEDRRDLKRFWLAVRTPSKDQWEHVRLLDLAGTLNEDTKSIAAEARRVDPKLHFIEAVSQRQVTARAVPLAPPGSAVAPTPDKPHVYYGWVMRADLDGFTKRVEECFDDDTKLFQLASQFFQIMNAAADFTERHKESMSQLPWAGDNFTAAAVFISKEDYERAIPKRLVELTLDFDKDMREEAVGCGFGGWAYGVAGGAVHGNSGGNVYLAGVEVSDRRFLVGVGEGFGRSAQAFGDINPRPHEMVVYEPDWSRMDDNYREAFEPAVTVRGAESSLYRKALTDGLNKLRLRAAVAASATSVSFSPTVTKDVATMPYFG